MKEMLPHTGGVMRLVLLWMAVAGVLGDPGAAFWTEHAPALYRVRVETTAGAFTLEARREWAPIGADRFYNLVRAGFYDNSRFYRVTERFAQFGIAGQPDVAAVWRNVAIADDPVKQSNTRGRFAFAMTGPNARTTQIYICKVDMSAQDKDGFAPLGEVVAGMDVVDRLYAGYGETSGGGMRAARQGRIFEQGNAGLDRDFPKLDRLLSARVIR